MDYIGNKYPNSSDILRCIEEKKKLDVPTPTQLLNADKDNEI